MNQPLHTVIFDLGNVLIGWQPRALFQKVFATEAEVDFFLTEVANLEWNEEQDRGRSIAEGTAALIGQHPNFEREIRIYYDRWTETITGPIAGTVEILEELKATGSYRLLALTNWSHELFPWARANFAFLQHFEDILVSGEVKMKKPEPRIYELLRDRYQLGDFSGCVFIDDSARNIAAAQALGLDSIHFTNPTALRTALANRGISLN